MSKTATMHAQQRWEYETISRKTESYLAGDLNRMGDEGWELVSVNYAKGKKEEMFWTAFLKRPAVGPRKKSGEASTVASASGLASSSEEYKPNVDASSEPQGFDLEGGAFKIHGEHSDDEKTLTPRPSEKKLEVRDVDDEFFEDGNILEKDD